MYTQINTGKTQGTHLGQRLRCSGNVTLQSSQLAYSILELSVQCGSLDRFSRHGILQRSLARLTCGLELRGLDRSCCSFSLQSGDCCDVLLAFNAYLVSNKFVF